MAIAAPAPPRSKLERLERVWLPRPGILGWLTTVDHKRIGLLYFAATSVFFLAGGVEALVMRTQLAEPNEHLVGPSTYDELFTTHAITMIFLFVIPMSTGALGDGFDDLLVDLVDGEVALDEDDAVGLAGGDLAVLFPDAAEEGVLLGFKAVFVAAGFGFDAVVAAARAGQRRFEAGEKQKGEVGLKSAADEAMEIEHNLRAEFAAAALVGFSRIGEAVADDDLARVEGRLDDFGDGLRAIGKHESHLGHGIEATRTGVEQDFANAIADGGAAGLAEQDGLDGRGGRAMPPGA